MPEPEAPMGTLLGFDFGLRRVGVAVGQTQTHTASVLVTLINTGALLEEVDELVRQWRPAGLVVGLPLDSEGHETQMSRQARQFGATLADRYQLPVLFEDERLSSQAVDQTFANQRAAGIRRKKDARLKDAMAAQLILQNWLQSQTTG